jgi:hypothetical protein
MPIPKWCDKKSIRSIKRGKASILICCPKRHFKSGRCSVGTRAIDVLTRGTKKERQEHPWASKARDHLKRDSRAYGAFSPRAEDPTSLLGSKINVELDRLDKESSKLTEEFIATGRGYEKPSETWTKDDDLAHRYKAISRRQAALRNEIEQRYGPGAPSRLPRGFGPRK